MPRQAENNLLLALEKGATSRENFTTGAFSHLLRYLLEHDAPIAVGLLRLVTEGRLALNPEQAELVSVQAQETTEQGIPDLVVRAPGHVVVIEVKVESAVDADQLKRYRNWLAEQAGQRARATTLVLLTRYPVSPQETHGYEDVRVRWCDVGEWLRTELSEKRTVQNSSSVFLVEQFLAFLKGVNMTMDQVTWELPAGIRSLMSLMNMVRQAVAAAGCIETKKSAGAEFNGTDFKDSRGRCWLGLYLRPARDSGSATISGPDGREPGQRARPTTRERLLEKGVRSVFGRGSRFRPLENQAASERRGIC